MNSKYILTKVVLVLKCLGGIATTPRIVSECKKFGDTKDIRKTLRTLERKGILKSDRPFEENGDLTLRWEFISPSTIDKYLDANS